MTFGRAAEVIRNRKTKVTSWYLDASMPMNYWEAIVCITIRAHQHDLRPRELCSWSSRKGSEQR
ncbi:MAG: hypothetical protein R3B96_00775 [Pirellulaceae bacterium]